MELTPWCVQMTVQEMPENVGISVGSCSIIYTNSEPADHMHRKLQKAEVDKNCMKWNSMI